MTGATVRLRNREWTRTASRTLGALAAATLAAGVLASCASPGGAPPAVTAVSTRQPSIPLTSSSTGRMATWATLAMGHLADPDNTFWQLLSSATGTSRFVLVTPPGVASNGGLVASVTVSGSVLAGFEPTQDLSFSPLARTADQGAHWSPGVLPGGLARVPDSLAASDDGPQTALLRAGGGRVVVSTGDLMSWKAIASRNSLDGDASTKQCGIQGLTAVAPGAVGLATGAADATEAGGPILVGAACAHAGRLGIFESVGAHWKIIGPSLRGAPAGPTEVIRLLRTSTGAAALVSAGALGDATLFAVWSTADLRSWTVSSGLPLVGDALISTGTTVAGGFVVTSGGVGGRRSVSTVDPSGDWRGLVPPPASTSTVVATPGGTFEALIADGSDVGVYSLGGGKWERVQTLRVPIQYGSSS